MIEHGRTRPMEARLRAEQWRRDSSRACLDKTDGGKTPGTTVEARLRAKHVWTRPMEARLRVYQRRRDSGSPFLDKTDGGETPGITVEARLRFTIFGRN